MIGPFEQTMLTAILFVVMLGMGAAITFRDVGTQLRRPGILILAVAGQFLIMPLTAFLLALALALPSTQAIGLVLMGCMPGGTTSNLYTYFAKANLSLSVIVTIMTTLVAIVLTPLLLLVYGGALAGDIQIPLPNVIVSLILLILPVFIGMAVRRRTANVGGALEVSGSVLGIVFILLLLVTWVPGNWPLLLRTPWQVYAGAIALPLIGMLLAYNWGRIGRLSPKDRRTLSLEIGIVNGPLAIAIVLLSFSGAVQQDVLLIPALYSMFVVLTSTLVTLWYRRSANREEQKIPELL